jgi:hypothetical protein
MMRNKKPVLFIIAFITAAVLAINLSFSSPASPGSAATLQEISVYQAHLTGTEEVPHVDTLASGRFIMTLQEGTLYYWLMVADITDVTVAHIHEGGTGQIGDPIIWLIDPAGVNAPAGPPPVTGSAPMTAEQIAALQAGNLYVNVHTEGFPGGEIRGQIVPFDPLPENFNALLTPEEEVHEVVSDALGVARFNLTAENNLAFEIHVDAIENITQAHIHPGFPGEDNPPLHWLYDVTGANAPGGPFGPGEPITGMVPLDAQNLVDLLSGYYYVNVHTTAYPAGEIRGQIGGVRLFYAPLTGTEEVPAVDTQATGKAFMTLDAAAETLHYRLIAHDIVNITQAHIHLGERGVNGPVVHWLFDPAGVQTPPGIFDPDNPYGHMVTFTEEDLFDLLAGRYYVNVHTAQNPGGEIRGQIRPYQAPDHFNAMLTGREEVPPVATDAVGVSRFTFDSALDTLHYTIFVRDIANITQAHFHAGWRGENGPVVHWLYDPAGVQAPGGPFDPDNPVGGAIMLDAQSTLDLLSGFYYVNVHSQTYPAGEIRGQVGGVRLFHGSLSGDEEVPPVVTPASGMGVMALSADTGTLYYRLLVNEITGITQAHIHLGPRGVNGDIVHWLYDPAGVQAPGGPFDPGNPVSGSLAFTTENIMDLLVGDYYINVHTSAHPGGEIRGQIGPRTAPQSYLANLSGAEEVPPVSTAASGQARFTFFQDLDNLLYQVSVADITGITQAHIHLGPRGVNGDIVHWLYDPTGVQAPGNTFDPDNPVGGSIRLDAENLVDLLTRFYYVNVHTETYPAGEIRGQIFEHHQLMLPIIFRNGE